VIANGREEREGNHITGEEGEGPIEPPYMRYEKPPINEYPKRYGPHD